MCVSAALYRAYIPHHVSCGSNMTRHKISARTRTSSYTVRERERHTVQETPRTRTRSFFASLTRQRTYRADNDVQLQGKAPIGFDVLRCSLQEEYKYVPRVLSVPSPSSCSYPPFTSSTAWPAQEVRREGVDSTFCQCLCRRVEVLECVSTRECVRELSRARAWRCRCHRYDACKRVFSHGASWWK